MEFAVIRHAGSHHLRQAVDVIGLDVQALLDLVAHLIRPGLRAADAAFELDLVDLVLPLQRLGDMQEVTRRAGDHRRLEIDQHRDEFLRVAGGHRDDHRSQLLCAVMGAQSAGEQAVAVTHQDDVLSGHAGHRHAARHTLGPDIHITPRVGADLGFAGGAARRMDPDDLGARHRQKSQRISGRQILIGHERQLLDVLDPADIAGFQSDRLHLPAVVLHIVVHTVHLLL